MAKLAAPNVTYGTYFPTSDEYKVEFEQFSFNRTRGEIGFKITNNITLKRWDAFQIGYLKDATGAALTPPSCFFLVTKIEESLSGTKVTAKAYNRSEVTAKDPSTYPDTLGFLQTRKSGGQTIPTHGVGFIYRPVVGKTVNNQRAIVGWDPVDNATSYHTAISSGESGTGTIYIETTKTDNFVELNCDNAGQSPYWTGRAMATGYDDSDSSSIHLTRLGNWNVSNGLRVPTVTWRKARLADWGHGYSLTWEDETTAIFTGRLDSMWSIGDLFKIGGYNTIFRITSINGETIRTAVEEPSASLTSATSYNQPFDILPHEIKNGIIGYSVRWNWYNKTDAGSEYVVIIEKDGEEVDVKFVHNTPESTQRLDSTQCDFLFAEPGDYTVKVASIARDARTTENSPEFGEVSFRIEEDQPEVIMAGDTFGAAQVGRAQQNGRFYSIRETDVPANTVFMPGYSTSPFFGVNEVPIPANKLGAYATTGIFCFDFPDGWTSVEGQAVYYKPTSATEGTFSATPSTGAVRIGFEVFQPNVAGKLCVYIQPGAGLES